MESGQVIKELPGHNDDITAIAFSPDGSLLASGSGDTNIKLWNVKKGSFIETLRGNTSGVLALDFNDDGSRLVSGSGDKLFGGKSELIVWDVKKSKKITDLRGNEGYISKVIYRGNRIYSIGNDTVLKVFDGDDFSELSPLFRWT